MKYLLHYLFGWHFIAFDYGSYTVVRLVRIYPNGIRYVKVCGQHFYLADDEYTFTNMNTKYVPLTWD